MIFSDIFIKEKYIYALLNGIWHENKNIWASAAESKSSEWQL